MGEDDVATYTMRAHNGLTPGHAANVRGVVDSLVEQAADGVGWNLLGTAPSGFQSVTTGNKVEKIHPQTGIKFKAGFQMRQQSGSQKWENHAKAGGYRLDLQGIANGWANWAIQTQGTNSVTVATCLMEVDSCFGQRHLVHALIQSAEQNMLCELTA
jgi:hypothetical protein